ncbi:Cytochrome bd-I ubiquinol oxidase subunit X [Marinomonas gallaica]|uniref:Cytochrome bd-I ubiquinol oxidase subunit X n=1 Tax=Marinomonas gallaica TaxID=1806667 RepID=A0A1C3JSY6_9GAMM|nr:cytochrome bd-I oxidase subunit CydX [Marinomonas gallaica]SBT18169.1 Cytochrome bd-I ubiquinol oxidase subunit X [Marinomonas gallaica]SBT22549.1 Cytochrome bd-I ubiquinol oxidase subunit X [Marinomonas gallaica]
MWYFAWVLGVLLACSFGIINAVWLEFYGYDGESPEDSQ